MARVLLDSDAVIDILGGFRPAIELVNSLLDSGDTLCTCAVVIAEVVSGVEPDELSRIADDLGALTFLVAGPAAATAAGRWRYEYRRLGQSLSTSDLLIAATALSHDATIVTGNVRDFPMPELTLIPLPRVRR